eukprot:IDg19408t1
MCRFARSRARQRNMRRMAMVVVFGIRICAARLGGKQRPRPRKMLLRALVMEFPVVLIVKFLKDIAEADVNDVEDGRFGSEGDANDRADAQHSDAAVPELCVLVKAKFEG